ncbi:MAG: sugar kinase [candidate division KSB1 bacterium]|nr:sugar kinase [candidate division KSB1 bacterium]
MSAKIVTLGEIMLRLAPYHYERIVQAGQFQATYGGGEGNVAVSLAQLGNHAWFVTRLPENPVGDAALDTLRRYGVDTEYVLRGGTRLGIYFLEHGASIRPSNVTYDRAHSAISEIQPGMVDWPAVFRDKDWFHVTGITPAISESASKVSLEAVQVAKKAGLKVSCDLNYRKKLWTRDQARAVMTELVQYVDVIIANEEDAADVFGIHAEETDVTRGKLDTGIYQSVARQLMDQGGAELVAITLRESLSASDNNWSAMLYDGDHFYSSRKYHIHLVDRVGGGDSFGAGLIHAILAGMDRQTALEFAVAASGMKQTIPGDMNLMKESEVLKVVQGDISGRVQR